MPPFPPDNDIVRLEQLVKIYQQPGTDVAVHALRGITLSFRPGEYVAIVGASGSGKSTLMNILGCLDRPTAGTYWLDGEDVSQLNDDRLSDVRGQRIGFIFQNFNLIATQNVLDNLETPLFYQNVPPRQRRERAEQMSERVGLADRATHRPCELSGGQQQRVAVGRALMNNPVILLADEPTGNLDSKTGQVILALLDELHESGMTIVVVTHDQGVSQRCERTVELRDGRVARDQTH
ncbi:MAG: ABC transporter ATP-binding protein [Planctomycetes bacterium]|nr:ABC transporter ATP-binding protein [Planctomycetota bacterium]